MNLTRGIGLLLISYLLGCFTAGYYLVRWRTGQDIRQLGSGNVGARNVSRVLGPAGFAMTFAVDFAKGAVAVWLARRFSSSDGLALLALLAVVSGHIWPWPLRFRGGKGAATAAGALLLYDYRMLLISLGVAAACLIGSKRTIPSGLLGFALLPVVGAGLGADATAILGMAVLSGLILIAHRTNLVEEFNQWPRRRKLSGKSNLSPK